MRALCAKSARLISLSSLSNLLIKYSFLQG
jgi:hypothetical protein